MENYLSIIIVQTIGFAAGLFKLYTDLQIKIKELDVRVINVEKREDDIYEIYNKIEKILDKVNNIEVKLEQKQNIK